MRKLGLALGITAALYAGPLLADQKETTPKMNDTAIRRVVPDAIEAAYDCFWNQFCQGKTFDAKCEKECPEKTPEKKPGKKKPSRSTPSKKTPSKPAPSRSYEAVPIPAIGDMRIVENWCAPYNASVAADSALIVKPQLDKANRNAGRVYRLVHRPDTPPALWNAVKDLQIERHELVNNNLQGPLDLVILDAKNDALFQQNKSYKPLASVGQYLNITAPECEAPRPVTPVTPRLPPRTEPEYRPFSPRPGKPLANAGPHSIEVKTGRFTNTIESGSYRTVRGVETFVPVNETLEGSTFGLQYGYTIPNTAFRFNYMHSTGSDNLDGNHRGQTNVNADAFGIQLKQAFTRWPVRPMVIGEGEYKAITFSDSYGPFVGATWLNNPNHTWRAGGGLQFGNQDANHADIAVGYQQQEMEFQRPGFVNTDERRGTGVTENGLFLNASGEGYLINNHLNPSFEFNYFKPNSQRTTDKFEEYKEGSAHNLRLGADWIFNPNGKHPVSLGVVATNAKEDGVIDRVPFHNTGNKYEMRLKLRF